MGISTCVNLIERRIFIEFSLNLSINEVVIFLKRDVVEVVEAFSLYGLGHGWVGQVD